MSGSSAWIRALTQPGAVTGDDLLRLWAEEDRETEVRRAASGEGTQQRAGEESLPALRLTDADIDRVAQALCRRLLDAAANM